MTGVCEQTWVFEPLAAVANLVLDHEGADLLPAVSLRPAGSPARRECRVSAAIALVDVPFRFVHVPGHICRVGGSRSYGEGVSLYDLIDDVPWDAPVRRVPVCLGERAGWLVALGVEAVNVNEDEVLKLFELGSDVIGLDGGLNGVPGLLLLKLPPEVLDDLVIV
jgi:hypothetical protein